MLLRTFVPPAAAAAGKPGTGALSVAPMLLSSAATKDQLVAGNSNGCTKMLLETQPQPTFQKRKLAVMTLPNFPIHLISRAHENEKYRGENSSVKVAATSSR